MVGPRAGYPARSAQVARGYATLGTHSGPMPRRPSTAPRAPARRALSARALLGPALALAAAAVAAPGLHAAPAQARSVLVVEGRGFGHGVGMSQYGAYGYALHGRSYTQILGHYYPGTTLARLGSTPSVGVLLATGRATVTVADATAGGGHRLDPRRAYTVRVTKAGRLELRSDRGHRLTRVTGPLELSAGGAAPVKLLGTAGDGLTDAEYRGTLVLQAEAGRRISVVDRVGLEDYLRGVVGAESPSTWPAAALRAQAVAARSYALATDAGGAGGAFTQYADTRSQVYHGVAAETAATDAAVAATGGQVLTFGGATATTYFFSTSGGRTERVENAFPGATPQPYLVSVRDPYDSVSPKHTWRVRLTMAQADVQLAGLVPGRLRRIEVLRRGASPRILRARIVGTRGSTTVDGATLRQRLGLDDTWASFSLVSTAAHVRRRTVTRPVAPDARGPSDGGASPRAASPSAVPFLRDLLGVIAPPATSFSGWASFGDVTTQGAQPTTGSAALAPAPVRTRRVHLRTVELRGRVTGRTRPVTLRLQRGAGGGHWKTVATLRTSARGFYAVTAPRPGLYRVRTRALVGPAVRVRQAR